MAYKSLIVMVCGATNVGKSTFVNFIMGRKISIVSPKVQTTQKRITAIYTENDSQLIFIDAPGFFSTKPKSIIEKGILKEASNLYDSDFYLLLVDAKNPNFDLVKTIIKRIKSNQEEIKSEKSIDSRVILVINKIDKVDKKDLLSLSQKLSLLANFKAVFMISVKKKSGVADLKNFLLTLPGLDCLRFDKEEVTTLSKQDYASEITREGVLMHLQQEIPYNVSVKTESWKDRRDKDDIVINQVIWVPNSNIRKIVIGSAGSMVKNIGVYSRRQLEKFFQKKINLKLEVRASKDWTGKVSFITQQL